MSWGRTLLLAAVLASLFSVAVGDGRAIARIGNIGKLGKEAVTALLSGPLALLDERSPGGRGRGALRSIKSRPYERALPTVRDRVTLLDSSPLVEIDIPPGTFAPVSYPQPGGNTPPEDFTPSAPFSQPFTDFPGIMAGGMPPLAQYSTTPPPGSGGSPPSPPGSGGSPSPPPPGSGGSPSLPPGSGGSPPPPPPPGSGETPPPPPVITPVPEPASWTMALLGLLAVGAAHQYARNQRRRA